MIKNSINGLVLGSILTLANIVPGTVSYSEISTEITTRASSSKSSKTRKRKEQEASALLKELMSIVHEIEDNGISKDSERKLYLIISNIHKTITEGLSNLDYNSISLKEANELLHNIEQPFKGWQLMYNSNKPSDPRSDIERKFISLFDDFELRFDQFITHLKILSDENERISFLEFYNGTYENDNPPIEEMDGTFLSSESLKEGWS